MENNTTNSAFLVRKASRMIRDEKGRRGLAALGRLVGASPQLVHFWAKTGKVSPNKCIDIEMVTGGKITRYELRPDVFGEKPE